MSDYDFIDDVVNEIMTNVKKDKPQKRKQRKVVPVEERCTKVLNNTKLCSFKQSSKSKYCSRHGNVHSYGSGVETKWLYFDDVRQHYEAMHMVGEDLLIIQVLGLS